LTGGIFRSAMGTAPGLNFKSPKQLLEYAASELQAAGFPIRISRRKMTRGALVAPCPSNKSYGL